MAIRTVVTRGFGNGTFTGTIALVVTRGYAIAAAVVVSTPASRTIGVGARPRIINVGARDKTRNVG